MFWVFFFHIWRLKHGYATKKQYYFLLINNNYVYLFFKILFFMSSNQCKFNGKCQRKNCIYSHEPSKGTMATVPHCRYGLNCTRSNCLYKHPSGSFIDCNTTSSFNVTHWNSADSLMPYSRINNHRQRYDSSHSSTSSTCHSGRNDHYNRNMDQRLSETELLEKIDRLLLKAKVQQEKFRMHDKEWDDDDDDRISNISQENDSEELKNQKNEFQSAINELTKDYIRIHSSSISSIYDLWQLERIHNQLEREFQRWESRLPIYARRSDIIKKLEKNQVFILKADTGSGKSTQIVQYLCDEHFADQSMYRIISNFL